MTTNDEAMDLTPAESEALLRIETLEKKVAAARAEAESSRSWASIKDRHADEDQALVDSYWEMLGEEVAYIVAAKATGSDEETIGADVRTVMAVSNLPEEGIIDRRPMTTRVELVRTKDQLIRDLWTLQIDGRPVEEVKGIEVNDGVAFAALVNKHLALKHRF